MMSLLCSTGSMILRGRALLSLDCMSSSLPRVLFCTYEIPQSINAGSMQLFRVLQDYPAKQLMVLGPTPERDADLLPCRYERLQLLTYRLSCTRFREWFAGLNALTTF